MCSLSLVFTVVVVPDLDEGAHVGAQALQLVRQVGDDLGVEVQGGGGDDREVLVALLVALDVRRVGLVVRVHHHHVVLLCFLEKKMLEFAELSYERAINKQRTF